MSVQLQPIGTFYSVYLPITRSLSPSHLLLVDVHSTGTRALNQYWKYVVAETRETKYLHYHDMK